MPRAKAVRSPAGASVTVKHLVQVSKALGHPVRVRILAMLSRHSLCVCQMASSLGLAYPTVSGHLNELRRCGLILEDKQGKLVFNHLDDSSPFARMVADALALARRDQTLAHDEALINRVRAVPIPVLTRARLNLKRLGIQRLPARRSPAARA